MQWTKFHKIAPWFSDQLLTGEYASYDQGVKSDVIASYGNDPYFDDFEAKVDPIFDVKMDLNDLVQDQKLMQECYVVLKPIDLNSIAQKQESKSASYLDAKPPSEGMFLFWNICFLGLKSFWCSCIDLNGTLYNS